MAHKITDGILCDWAGTKIQNWLLKQTPNKSWIKKERNERIVYSYLRCNITAILAGKCVAVPTLRVYTLLLVRGVVDTAVEKGQEMLGLVHTAV